MYCSTFFVKEHGNKLTPYPNVNLISTDIQASATMLRSA